MQSWHANFNTSCSRLISTPTSVHNAEAKGSGKGSICVLPVASCFCCTLNGDTPVWCRKQNLQVFQMRECVIRYVFYIPYATWKKCFRVLYFLDVFKLDKNHTLKSTTFVDCLSVPQAIYPVFDFLPFLLLFMFVYKLLANKILQGHRFCRN